MALVLKDRVQETTTTTGTGTLTLSGGVDGFQSFSVIGDGNTTFYSIVFGASFEVGIGTYTSSGTTLSRDTILSSSNSNNAVNFGAGTKNVFVTYPASKSINLNSSNNLDLTGVSIISSSNGNITLTPNGSGAVVLDGLSYPQTDGTVNQILKTNGSGVLSFADEGNITVEGNYFSNYNTITADVTTTVASTVNGFLSGPITVNSGFTWTIASGSELRIL